MDMIVNHERAESIRLQEILEEQLYLTIIFDQSATNLVNLKYY